MASRGRSTKVGAGERARPDFTMSSLRMHQRFVYDYSFLKHPSCLSRLSTPAFVVGSGDADLQRRGAATGADLKLIIITTIITPIIPLQVAIVLVYAASRVSPAG